MWTVSGVNEEKFVGFTLLEYDMWMEEIKTRIEKEFLEEIRRGKKISF